MTCNLPPTLYRPQFEHDACGIGFVARTTGIPGHDIVQMGLEAVGCMEHRSGIDADGLSGDGAGILTQLPHRLLAAEIADLPAPGDNALGMLFLPPDKMDIAVKLAEETIAQVLAPYHPSAGAPKKNGANGKDSQSAIRNSQFAIHNYLSWRAVPVNVEALGRTARKTRPEIRQILLRRPAAVGAGDAFERLLFAIRKRLVQAYRQAGMNDGENDIFYVASLSAQTVVYKGLMLSP